MSEKNLSLSSDILNENQNDICDRTSLKNLKRKKIFSSKKKKNTLAYKTLLNYLLVIIICLIMIIILILIFIFFKNKNYEIPKEPLINKEPEEEYKDSIEYWKMIEDGILYNKNKIYNLSNNPKISIIIPVYNGEGFIKNTIISIQNQDLKDIEIIIIDDKSTDNSINIIKEIMKTEPRIILYENEENKGVLYTKTRGVLLSKGKYVMIIDDDDKYLQRDAFTTLYAEAEKYNLDILEFKAIPANLIFDKGEYEKSNNKESPIIYQDKLSDYMFYRGILGIIEQNDLTKVKHLINRDLFIKEINQIDSKYLNVLINYYEDNILFFLLTRNAKSLKKIDRIFYVKEKLIFSKEEKLNYRKRERLKDGFNLSCFALLNYIEILFNKTKNTTDDKKIAFSQFEQLYISNQCKSNIDNKEKALELCNIFLESEYISFEDKRKIRYFLKQFEQQQHF